MAPAGLAWHIALKSDPTLILHYIKDRCHPNYKGSYLAACVIYAAITGKSPLGLKPFELRDSENAANVTLDDAEAASFQQAAWEAIRAFKEYMEDAD